MILRILKKLRNNEDGSTAVEYGLIASLIAVTSMVAVERVGGGLGQTFEEVAVAMSGNASDGGGGGNDNDRIDDNDNGNGNGKIGRGGGGKNNDEIGGGGPGLDIMRI